MYKYTFSKNDTDDIEQKSQAFDKLLSDFKDVEDKYFPKDDSLKLEKMTFNDLDDEEIKEKAEKSLQEYKTAGTSDIENKYTEQSMDIENDIINKQKSGEVQKQEIENLYDTAKQNASDDALKRGLSRSSIVINVLDAFDKNLIEEYQKINNDIKTTIDGLNSKMQSLETEKADALNNFDLTYALKVDEKISSIKSDLQKEEQKVIEYNNKIAETEEDYKLKERKERQDIAEYVDENFTMPYQLKIMDDKYEIFLDYIKDLSKEEIEVLLEDKDIMQSIGAKNINKIKMSMY